MKRLLVLCLALNAVTMTLLAVLLWQVLRLSKDADDAFAKVDDVAAEVKSAAQFLKSQGVYGPDEPDGGLLADGEKRGW